MSVTATRYEMFVGGRHVPAAEAGTEAVINPASLNVGKPILRAASGNLKRVHLELGGKAPVIVFDDADLAQVTEAIKIGGYLNSGDDCTAASRVYASERIHDDLKLPEG